MPNSFTQADSLIVTKTTTGGSNGIGGLRSSIEVQTMDFLTSTPIPQIVILAVSGANGEGTGKLSAESASTLSWTPPGDTKGTAVTIAANETKLITGLDPDKWIRVFWDGEYSIAGLGGGDDVLLLRRNIESEDRDHAENEYAGYMLTNLNANSQPVTSLKVWIAPLSTPVVTATTQLPSSGAGTIQTATANGFATWPAYGYAHVKQTGGTTREIVYYTSRTATVLTVPAAGRGLLGTSAGAGAGTDTVEAVPGVRLAKEEADSEGKIQEIADIETAPTGVTWNTSTTSAAGLTNTTLPALSNLGLWVHRQTPSVALPVVGMEATINFEYTVEGETYANAIPFNMNLRDTALEGFELYASTGTTHPDVTGTPVDTGASPLTYVLTPPGSGTLQYNFIVIRRNAYNLTSKNQLSYPLTIDDAGVEIAEPISSPIGTTLTQVGSGKVRIRSAYAASLDATPADTWIAYVTTTGVDPNPGTDTPITLSTMASADLLTGLTYLDYTSPSQEFGTDYRVIVRAKKTNILPVVSVESENVTVQSLTVTSGLPAPRHITVTARESFGLDDSNIISLTEIDDSRPLYIASVYGQSVTLDTAGTLFNTILQSYGDGYVYIPSTLDLVNSTISGTGTGDVEVVDADTIYLNVNGTRRVKIDRAGGTIEADTFIFNGPIDNVPNAGPVDDDNGKLYLMVYNKARNRYEPFIQVDSSGVLTFGPNVIQRES
jgi:hypothetical protein